MSNEQTRKTLRRQMWARRYNVFAVAVNVAVLILNVAVGNWFAIWTAVLLVALGGALVFQTRNIRNLRERLRPRPDYSRIASMERDVWGEAFEHAGAPAPLPRVVATRRTYACTVCGRDAHTTRRMCARCYKQQMKWGY